MTTPAPALVFVGDSITDAGRDRGDAGSLGDGFVSLVADELGRGEASVRVVNVGIAGNRAVDLAGRWEEDVAPHGADVLTIFVGVNDMWRRFDQDDPTSAEAFEETYRSLIAESGGAGALILMEPFFLPVRKEQRAWLDDLDPKRDVVRRLAAEAGAALVPLYDLMWAAADREGVAAIAPDGVHPTAGGSRVIADAWLAAYDSLARRD